MKHYNLIILLASLSLICFTLLSKYEDREVVKSIDFAATVKVQDHIDKSAHLRLASFVDNTMEGATFFASPEFSIIIILFITIIMFIKRGFRALAIPLFFGLLVLVEIFGKTIVHHPSPPFAMIKHTTSVFPANYINEQFSYPSGHAARAVFISIIALILVRKRFWMGGALLLYVLLVAVSRIYLGHHWLSDVVGGGLLGSGIGTLLISVL